MNKFDEITMYELALLHSRADRALRFVIARALEQYGITMMQWLLLATVQNGPKNGMRMSELADTLDVTMPQITALMNDVVKLKLAKQKINNHDRRSRQLMITSGGSQQLKQIEATIDKTLRSWLNDIDNDELGAYITTVQRLAELDTDQSA